MKNGLIIAVLIACFSTTALAQIEKNSWMIGGSGNAGAYNTGFGNNLVYNLQLQATVGYFVANNFALGISPGFLLIGSDNSSFYNVILPAFSRYYFNVSERISLFPELNGGLGLASNANNTPFYLFNVAVGASFWINKNVAFEPKFEYSIYDPNQVTPWVNKKIPQLKLGFQIYLNRGNE
ncbi:MAG: hypothetical protein WEC59_05575 [Salibacteraceae bacterium]